MTSKSPNFINEFDYFRNLHNTFRYNNVFIDSWYLKLKFSRRDSDDWLLKQLEIKLVKSEEKAEHLRILGNEYFKKKDFRNCYYYYTRSLCFARPDCVNYGLALGNRSALLYEMGDYEVIFLIITIFYYVCIYLAYFIFLELFKRYWIMLQ